MKLILTFCLIGALQTGAREKVFAQEAASFAATERGDETPAGTKGAPPAEAWWRLFRDPLLDSLVSVGLTQNLELQAVVSRVEEARARVRVAESFRYPALRLEPYLATQTLAPNRPVALLVPDGRQIQRFSLNTYQVPLTVSYELDLWQRVKKQVKASTLQLQSVEAAYEAARLTVASEVARQYLLLRATDTERSVLRRSIGLRDSTLQIARARFAAGLVSEMDVQRAETEVATARFQRQALDRSRAELELSLAVLLGLGPGKLRLPEANLPAALPSIPASAPAELAFRRPDLVQAERLVDAAKGQTLATKAAMLPRLNLLGSAGLASREISTLASQGSGTYLVGAGISVPVFEGYRNKSLVTVAEKQAQTQSLVYQQRVLEASQEVETALANLRGLAEQAASQQQALQAAQKTRRYARELYAKGLTSFLEALDAERTALELERQAVNLKGQQALYTLALIKALGGSW